MLELFLDIIGRGKHGVCNLVCKVIVTFMICKNKDLSDSKVQSICEMMAR